MQLLLPGGESLPVAQSGPDFLILEQPLVRPPSAAELVVDVDGSVSRFPFFWRRGLMGLGSALSVGLKMSGNDALDSYQTNNAPCLRFVQRKEVSG